VREIQIPKDGEERASKPSRIRRFSGI